MQPASDIETVFGATLVAVGRGAQGMAMEPGAVEVLRQRFRPRIETAMADPLWRQRWRAEHCYVLVQAEAMGQCAARLATEGRRTAITPGDVETAMLKLRGRLPVAGRWCPF